ncbi:MAG TPA: hypothetical protein DFR83_13860 [Deltaproteobacteria bacterium]|nr:hypothetical protein [Deltaproteobacteria bacterium]
MLPVNAPETQALQEQHARVSQVPGAMWGAFLLASIAAGTAALGKFDWGLVALTAAPFLFLVGRQALQRHRQRMVMRIDA